MNDIRFADTQTQDVTRTAPGPCRDSRMMVGTRESDNTGKEELVIELGSLQAMVQHAITERDLEVGGILLGVPWRHDDGERGVWIRESLPASHHRNSETSFTFTHDSWSTLHAEWRRRCPDLSIVGWYHTHPGWGIFLSAQDRFVCDHYFSEWYHVAIVLDPRSMIWGMFDRLRSTEQHARSTFWLRYGEQTNQLCQQLSHELVSKRPSIFQMEPLMTDPC